MGQRLGNIAVHYRSRHRRNGNAELRPFKQYSFKTAVEKAGLAEDEHGKRFNHQRRIPKKVLLKSQRVLWDARQKLCCIRTFEELHESIQEFIGSIDGIGRLAIYDTALRIGANRGLSPKAVYLHAGTLKGAGNLGLYKHKPTLPVSEIPAPLRRLKPLEIEDVLCIYKDCFICQKRKCPLPKNRCGDKGKSCSDNTSKGCC